MIIGICGLIGSGKDTTADYLVNFHEFRRESFAGTLKDAVAAVFGWDRELLEGRTKSSRAWREQVDPWWADRLGMPNLTPRLVLQLWGTEVARRAFHDDTWIASLENKLRNSSDDVVVTDCRFPNEVQAIKRAGGIVVRVTRGPDPEWWDLAVESMRGTFNHMLTAYPDIHASEYSWAGTEFDAVLSNSGSIDDLYARVRDLVTNLQAATVNHSS